MRKITSLLILYFILFSCEKSFTEKFQTFETKLIIKEKSFQSYKNFLPQQGDYKLINYTSDGMKLKALLNSKHIDSSIKKPVIVYLHGGFALRSSELEAIKGFTEDGFIVFAPSFRGENGNPGYFELFMGEVQDAISAIDWISEQSYVDADRIYVFGWSVGGGIALNLSLHDELPIQFSGSSAGLYDYDLIKSWATEDDMIKFPYDYENEEENYYRLSLYNLQNMMRPHYTYIGRDDDYEYYKNIIDSLYPNYNTHLRLRELLGNHVSSLPKAVRKFSNEIRKYEKIIKKNQ